MTDKTPSLESEEELAMAIYRVFPDADGESHIEEMKLEHHPDLGALINISEK